MNNNDKLEKYEYSIIKNKDKISVNEIAPPKYGVRHSQLALSFICLTIIVMVKVHVGVTIVTMTSKQNKTIDIINKTLNENVHLKRNNTSMDELINNKTQTMLTAEDIAMINSLLSNEKRNIEIYDWPKYIQEMVLNAFYLGHLIAMFPSGILCQRYGGKLVLQIALFVNGITSIGTPWLTVWGGWKAVCLCRIIQGLTLSGTYPSLQVLLAKWSPANERATLSSVVYTGSAVGTVAGYQLAGFLGASSWGWPSIFYTIGVICLICFTLITVYGVTTPMEHKTISEEEKKFIMKDSNHGNHKKLKIPWLAIVTSKSTWGLIATQVGSTVSFIFFFNQVPSYIHYILGYDVKNSGIMSSLPFIASFFTSLGFGFISDYCTNNKIVSIKNARRISNSISQCSIAFFLILTSYTTNTLIAMTALVIGLSANVAIHTGWMVNAIDLTPNFSGTLIAIGGTISDLFAALTPVVVSYVLTDMTSVIQWRIIFCIIASLALVMNTVFVVLISTDIQPWNNPEPKDSCFEKEETELE